MAVGLKHFYHGVLHNVSRHLVEVHDQLAYLTPYNTSASGSHPIYWSGQMTICQSVSKSNPRQMTIYA